MLRCLTIEDDSRITESALNLPNTWHHEVAKLHLKQIPNSIICSFGFGGLSHYYRWASKSDSEFVVVLCREGAVIGASLLSHSPVSVGGRALFGGLWLYSLNLFTQKEIWALIVSKLTINFKANVKQIDNVFLRQGVPEVLQIFVSEDAVGEGLGFKLIKYLATHAHNNKCSGLLVRTESNLQNRALNFYKKCGFVEVGSSFSGTKRLTVFFKSFV